MKSLLFTLLTLTMLLGFSVVALGAIYKYTDDNGRMFFVDDADKVPPQYRNQVDSIQDRHDTPETSQSDTEEDEESAFRVVDPVLEQQALKQARTQEKRRSYQTPVMVHGNRVMIPAEVSVGNRIAHLVLLLDTGASATVLHRQALSKLNLPKGEKVKARVAGGQNLDSEKIPFRYIEVGPHRKSDMPAMVIETQGPQLPFDGMLGMDFLREHPYRIDYDREMVFWEFRE